MLHKPLITLSPSPSLSLFLPMFSMENRIRKRTFMDTSDPPSLAMHRDSQTLSKTKPKIRIIHIFAPEIIKTDVENFRELVQRLTGKPSGSQEYCKKKKKPRIAGRDQEARSAVGAQSEKHKMITMNMELRNGFGGLDQSRDRIKDEAGLCNNYENSGGYLGGFSELEGFISELAEFPLFPLDGTHMQGFAEPQLA